MKDHLKDTERRRSAEFQYLDLLKDVLKNGVKNVDRGTKAVSYGVFGRQTRYDLSLGFPLLTTKKVYWKGVLHELYWFMSGQTNIKYLVDNGVHIWDDYPYKIFLKKKSVIPSHLSLRATSGSAAILHTEEDRNPFDFAQGKLPRNDMGGVLSKEEFIEKIRTDSKFAKEHGNLPRIYGEMWRSWPTKSGRTIDQLQWVIDELTQDPYARNAIVTSWNPEYLYTMATREDTSYFPICHNMYQVNIKDGKLSLQLYQRSADLFLGVPFNIASYALLTIILAQVLGYKPGEFIHTFGDAHIYENHIEQVKEQLKREPRPFPKVTLDTSIKTIDDFRPEHVALEGYDPHPFLKGDLTIAGGFYERT